MLNYCRNEFERRETGQRDSSIDERANIHRFEIFHSHSTGDKCNFLFVHGNDDLLVSVYEINL